MQGCAATRQTSRNPRFGAKLRRGILLVYLLAWGATAETRPLIVFSCWVPPQFTAYGEMEVLYRDAFDALGYDFQMQHRPSQRSLQEAVHGVTDGECIRTGNVLTRSEDFELIRVDALLVTADLEAWGTEKPEESTRFSSMADLAQGDYRIGYPRGAEAVPELIARFQVENTHPVANPEVGLRMLAAGRLDFYVDTGPVIRMTLREMDLPVPLYAVGKLMPLEGYPYLNRRHQHLLPDLARELRARLSPEGLSQH